MKTDFSNLELKTKLALLVALLAALTVFVIGRKIEFENYMSTNPPIHVRVTLCGKVLAEYDTTNNVQIVPNWINEHTGLMDGMKTNRLVNY